MKPVLLLRRALRRSILRRPSAKRQAPPYPFLLLLTLLTFLLSALFSRAPPSDDMSVVLRALSAPPHSRPLSAAAAAAAAGALPLPDSASQLLPDGVTTSRADPLTSRVDAIVGDEAGAKTRLTDRYLLPAPVVANMSQSVASRLYWKLVYTDVVSALRAQHDSGDDMRSHPRFEAKARVLFVHTQNGLGNRLRALASGLAIARATARVPVVVWERDAHLGAAFDQLFETSSYGSDIHTVLYKDLIVMNSFPAWRDIPVRAPEWYPVNYMMKDGKHTMNGAELHFDLPSSPESMLRPTNLMDSMGAIDNINPGDKKSPSISKENHTSTPAVAKGDSIEQSTHVYFKSAYVARALPEHLSDPAHVNHELMSLRPVQVVRNIVNTMQEDVLSNSIGIHIRSRSLANDNVKVDWNCEYTASGAETTDYWRKQSGLQVFLKQMTKVIQKEGDQIRFFVAADDVGVLNSLQQKFPGRIHSISRSCDDREHSCVIYALADLLCLARTQEIYGSNWSSFTEAAGRLGNKRIHLSGIDFGKKKPLPRWKRAIMSKIEELVQAWYRPDLNPYYKCTKHR